MGTIKSIGRIYQQTFLDTYSKLAFVKLYERKNALVAADLLNDRVLPLLEEQNVPLLRVLTDRGTEYCERFHRTLQEVWLGEYNEKREHSGKYCYGKTPGQTFLDSKHLAQAKMLDSLTATVCSDDEGQHAEPERSPAQRSGGRAQGTAA